MTSSAESAGSDAVSVIIPAHNAEATLADCLDAVMAQQAPGLTLEVLVVDDRSTDGTRSVACRPGVRLLDGSGRGPAAARNLGARSASGSILVFLDADTRPKPGWLNELLTPLVDPEVAAVKGAYDSDQRGLLARFAQLEFEYKYARLERAQRVDFVDTGTAAFRRDAFERIGGFDERFPA
ncbi:MAG TPA: glycosyltransferase, partial [Chloroflexota bacterium]